MLINFISNSFKFTTNGFVKLQIRPLKKDFEKTIIEFRISDSGIGFSLEQEKKLFTAFQQADNTITRQYGGTGLGLVICKNLIEMMGGQLNFRSQQAYGTEFVFTVVSENIQKNQMPVNDNKIEFQKLSNTKLKVLVADDVQMNQIVLSKTLSKIGYESIVVSNGLEAIERHEEMHFDLIFMDCQMPLLDGLQATRDIRRNENDEKCFIVALTGNATSQDRHDCMAAGMDYFISKPFTLTEIEKVIQMALNKKIKKNLRAS